ncbi:MAG: hypothetical protein KJZ65_13215 [Phycisphaerales bacterium]|nr:hypothetical protein [Phycisphaerales bacterium]
MKHLHRMLTIVAATGALTVIGCDESDTSSTNQGIKLADEPKSLAGRSAGTARDLAGQIANRDAQAGAAADALTGDGGSVQAGPYVFKIPSGWRSVPPSNNMRAAELQVNDAVAAFSMAGGSVDANINRWAGQFISPQGGSPEPKIDEIQVNGISVTLVELSGTYFDGAMTGQVTEKPDHTMLAAILPGPQMSVFIKFTGPTRTINEVRQQWMELVHSAQSR